MFRRLLNEEQNQNGEVMLEASFILVSVILLLMALLSLSFFFYQEAMMTSVANEIAADVAKNYKFTKVEVGKSDITIDDITSVKMFRMNFGKKGIKDDHNDRAKTYAEWRIGLATMGINAGDINVDCEITGSAIGRSYVKITVSQKTDFFLSGILDLMGITEEESNFGGTAYAECVDLMGYTSMVNFTEYGSRKLSAFNSIGGFYGSVKNFVQKLVD